MNTTTTNITFNMDHFMNLSPMQVTSKYSQLVSNIYYNNLQQINNTTIENTYNKLLRLYSDSHILFSSIIDTKSFLYGHNEKLFNEWEQCLQAIKSVILTYQNKCIELFDQHNK